MSNIYQKTVLIIVSAIFIFCSPAVLIAADEKVKPFVLGSNEAGSLSDKITGVKSELEKAGFTIAGEYSPYEGTHIVIVTNDQLKKAAASHDRAGYIAAQRVSITDINGKIQISYTYPLYMAAAYQVKADLADVTSSLKSALGFDHLYGPDEGKTLTEMGGYHYMFGMEYFDDSLDLNELASYEKAIEVVEKNLKTGNTGAFKVYRIDIPGTQQTLVGVGMKLIKKNGVSGDKSMDDQFIMSEIDFKEIRSAAHLPYEILIRGKKIEALHARFRIAINFTDLAMMGDHSFMNIMATPNAIQQVLTAVAGGSIDDDY